MSRTEWNVRYKENAPQETVDRIIGLLRNIGLETDYVSFGLDTKGCYSSRVSLNNPGLNAIASNGKGTTAEFCKASAYAELMERSSIYRDVYESQMREEDEQNAES